MKITGRQKTANSQTGAIFLERSWYGHRLSVYMARGTNKMQPGSIIFLQVVDKEKNHSNKNYQLQAKKYKLLQKNKTNRNCLLGQKKVALIEKEYTLKKKIATSKYLGMTLFSVV